jgi:hypothetical protein
MNSSLETASEIDVEVRRIVYDSFITHGISSSRDEVAARLDLPESEVAASFERLAAAHMLVLQPASGQVLMANPFSAVPTGFHVKSGSGAWWANCIWDALGILAMIAQDGTVETSCPDCGEALTLRVADGELAPSNSIVHFAVPAAHWWDNIVFT